MARFLAIALLLPGTRGDGCIITAKVCRNFPEFNRTQFRDTLGEEHLGTGTEAAACLKRAEDFHHWCGNGPEPGASVASTFSKEAISQIYDAGACVPGWSQFDAFCYKFFLEMSTWAEAEATCRDLNSHLVSIHSRMENSFVHGLAHGLKVWIGYTDIDQDTRYTWSDNTQDDFTNFAKNCSGRESEAGCSQPEVQQQWYQSSGIEKSPFVCKKNAQLPVSLQLNTTAESLLRIAWPESVPATSTRQKELRPRIQATLLPDRCAASSVRRPLLPRMLLASV